ncbi:unnamed protein product [Linum trigynum]|uniref:Uncharacterized protein n=1 Tax=Linum trigynum TaxID=586398 RepID=A0AAV2FC24_9ROSI
MRPRHGCVPRPCSTPSSWTQQHFKRQKVLLSRLYATPQPYPKRELKLMVEQFAWGTDKGCSSMVLPIAAPFDLNFLRESDELLRHMERLGGLVDQAYAQLARNQILPFYGRKEVEDASHENFGRTSSDMDFQPLPPPGLNLEEKVA